MPYGIPSGPHYGPNNSWIKHPKLRPGRRVRVVSNNEIVFHDMVGREGTLVRRNGGDRDTPTYLVYFDNYIDLNVPVSVLEFLPDVEQNGKDHLFLARIKEQSAPYELTGMY